jgi:hypothetical protein
MAIKVRNSQIACLFLAACLALGLAGCSLTQGIPFGAQPKLTFEDLPSAIQVKVVPAAGSLPLTISWNSLAPDASYAVIVAEKDPYKEIWIWTGQATQVAYGDPGIDDAEGLTGLTAALQITPSALLAAAPILDPKQNYLVSVLAYDTAGKFLGAGQVPLTQPTP